MERNSYSGNVEALPSEDSLAATRVAPIEKSVNRPRMLEARICSRAKRARAEHDGKVWNDPALGINWPIDHPILSEKDAQAPLLVDIDHSRFLRYESE